MPDGNNLPKVRLASYGANEVRLEGLTKEEVEVVQGSLHGCQWIRVIQGRVENIPVWKPPPLPAEDADLRPFWPQPKTGRPLVQNELFDPQELKQLFSCSISIQALCGYFFTPENYKIQSEKLVDWGFICLRSPRGEDGRYWEIWYLPGLWCTKGALAEAVACRCAEEKKDDERTKLKRALEFLRRNVTFGTLDVSVQRMAMSVPD